MDAEALAAEVVKVVVQNLIDYSMKEISLIRGLGKEAKKLSLNLNTIQKFLNDAETRTIEGDAVKSWLESIENAAFDADDVLDELNYHLLSNQIPTVKSTKEKLLSCFCSSFNHYIANPREMAHRIKEINDNLDFINAKATDLGLQFAASAAVPSLLDVAPETTSFFVDPIFIGRDGDASEVVGMLADITSGDGLRASIVSIVGMGGLGKTTLTRTVFNRVKGGELSQFGTHVWVYVSQIFDADTLFKKILEQLNPGSVETSTNRQVILSKLQQSLKDKTYLLVLDDVWNTDLSKWEDFIGSLLGATSTDGNAIVVTTRSTEVASTVNPLHTHELKGLSDEDCWSIIKAKAFGKEEGDLSEFKTIGRKIATRCQGLPLAANVVGGVLRSDKSEEKWLEIEEKWLPRDKGDNINKILKLSYNTLSPPSLKKCFAYCSVFPKGHDITKQKLIECWMAEGFLQSDGRDNDGMESVGDKFISILLHNSLLQDVERDEYGDVESCAMHDLVHDLAHSLGGAHGSRRTRYMSSSDDDIPEEVAKHLRTLFLFSEGELPDTVFSGFDCLHVLTVRSRFPVEVLPSSIQKLLHLRSLDVSDIETEILPEWIGELHHLQTLRAENNCTRKLPTTLTHLIKLRHLYINHKAELPAKIGRLTRLQTLPNFTVGFNNGCRIQELGSLDNLKGGICINRLERVGDMEEARKANLSKKSKLSSLFLKWKRINGEEGERHDDEDVLEGLRPHPNLKVLGISGFNGRRFPPWTLKMAVENAGLNKLIQIVLEKCCECEEIPMLGHLPNLKSLYISEMGNVKRINSSFYGPAGVAFPALEKFELHEMPNLAEFESDDQVHSVVLPRLQHLEIRGCERLMSVPSHFSSSSCLKQLRISKSGLESLPDCMFTNNPNLSQLEIRGCHNLRQVPRGLECLGSLEGMVIEECPKLERLVAAEDHDHQSVRGGFRDVRVSDCQSLVWLPCEMVVGSSLESLFLVKLGSLQNLPSLIDGLLKSPRLKVLVIVGVPNFVTSSCSSHVEIRPAFNGLTRIDIDASIGGSMETVDGILQGCSPSLDSLTLKGMETWECLPSSLQRLTGVRNLIIENFGMEELPEWLGNFSNLWALNLHGCKKLRRLASVDAMRRLTTLENFIVRDCKQLRIGQQQQQRQQNRDGEGDFEWDKISHIRFVIVDGKFLRSSMRGFMPY